MRPDRSEARAGWLLTAPALASILFVALFPLGWTSGSRCIEHDLRMPWLGRPFVGSANYVDDPAATRASGRRSATRRSSPASSVSLELVARAHPGAGDERAFRGRGLVRAAVLVPWAIPTVVAALLWRFMFDSQAGIANAVLVRAGCSTSRSSGSSEAATAWVPVILADVWKTTPFVALLLLAGLQNIDHALYEAAAIDGAGAVVAAPAHHAAAARARDARRAASSARSTPSACSTSSTCSPAAARALDGADRALHVQRAAPESGVRLRRGAVGRHLPRDLRARDPLHTGARRRRGRRADADERHASRRARRSRCSCLHRVPVLLGNGRLVHAGGDALRASQRSGRAQLIARPLPRAVRRERLLDADPELARRRRRRRRLFCVAIGVLAAYALARIEFRGKTRGPRASFSPSRCFRRSRS